MEYLYGDKGPGGAGGGGGAAAPESAAVGLAEEQKHGQTLDPNLLAVAGSDWQKWLKSGSVSSPGNLGGLTGDEYTYGTDTVFDPYYGFTWGTP